MGVVGISFSAIFVRYSTAPAAVLAFYRMGFSAILLLPTAILKERNQFKHLRGRSLLLCMISGFFLACHFFCYFQSISYTSVASSTVLVNTEVFFVAISSYFFFHERISKLGKIGIILTFVGSVVLAMSDHSQGSNAVIGDLLALCGAFFVSVYTMIGSRVRKTMTNTLYTFLVYSMAAVTLFSFNVISSQSVYGYEFQNYMLGFLLSIVCTLLGHSVLNWSLKEVAPTYISNVKLGEPVFATILSLFLFSQIPTYIQIVGGIIILLGIFLYLRADMVEKGEIKFPKEEEITTT